jgi:radical SAM protein with 4Fe4S-binding SPASM domain
MRADPTHYVSLAGHVSLRLLETPCLYDRKNDELYELNQKGFKALQKCRGHLRLEEAGLEKEFLRTCLKEGLLTLSPSPRPMPLVLGPSPKPSLRYLELQITWRCNLACRHCYLGPARPVDLPVPVIAAILREFREMGGLRVMISGGEPLLHPHWPEINALLAAAHLRRVLLTNGVALTAKKTGGLFVDEVQISLDGLKAGHDLLRGPGSFKKALKAAREVKKRGLDLSIATMAHAGNLAELDKMAELVRDLGVREWGIDAPCPSGRLRKNAKLAVSPQKAAAAMTHSFGGAYHGGSGGMACGAHLCTVAADGKVAQCGFYLNDPLGRAAEGLWMCWSRRKPLKLREIAGCAECSFVKECAGGCRFRAPDGRQPDPVMCALFGKMTGQL